jgi:hypothetical protein
MKITASYTRYFALGLGLCLLSQAKAQVSQNNYAAFGRLGTLDHSNFSARASALGTAFVGVSDDASALFSNPAGLGLLSGGEIEASTNLALVDTLEETITWGMPTGGWGGFGIAGTYLNYGTFQGRDEAGSLAPDYSAQRLGLRLGWGLGLFPETFLGLAVQGQQQTLADKGYMFFTAQFGGLVEPAKGFRIGSAFSYTGFGSSDVSAYNLLNIGMSYRIPVDPSFEILTATGGTVVSGAFESAQVGVEFAYLSRYFLRTGYRASINGNGLENFAGFTLGAGALVGNFNWNYAFLPYGNLGTSHRFDVGYLFDLAEKSEKKTSFSTSGKTGNKNLKPSEKIDFGSSPVKEMKNTLQPVEKTIDSQPANALGSAPGLEKDNAKDNLTVQFSLAPDLVAQGEAMETQGQPQKALAFYRQAAQEDGRNALAWWRMGNLYAKLQQKKYAIQCFEQVLKLQPNNQALAAWLSKYKVSTP